MVLSYCNGFHVTSNLMHWTAILSTMLSKPLWTSQRRRKPTWIKATVPFFFTSENFVVHIELLWMPTGVCRDKLYRPPHYWESSWTSGRLQQSEESSCYEDQVYETGQDTQIRQESHTSRGLEQHVCVHVKTFLQFWVHTLVFWHTVICVRCVWDI